MTKNKDNTESVPAFSPIPFEDGETFGVDLTSSTSGLRADFKKKTLRPGPGSRVPTNGGHHVARVATRAERDMFGSSL